MIEAVLHGTLFSDVRANEKGGSLRGRPSHNLSKRGSIT